jgi:cytochrome P450
MVLDEALRLYPPAAILPRQANAADVINGYTVPKNAVLLMSQYVTHRHPDFWPEPERFCPERFNAAQVAARHRFAYLPFGEGPRVCIGKPFALMEMQLALATIAQTYSLRLLAERPVVPHLATTLQPRDGLWMTVHAIS